MNYRFLYRKEWPLVEPVFKEYGGTLPVTGMIVAAEDEGHIVGFQALQPVMHVEPIWVKEEYRGRVNIMELNKTLTGPLPVGFEYYAFVPDRKIGLLAGNCGLKKLDWEVWKGVR